VSKFLSAKRWLSHEHKRIGENALSAADERRLAPIGRLLFDRRLSAFIGGSNPVHEISPPASPEHRRHK
jgi:hypothetical protein